MWSLIAKDYQLMPRNWILYLAIATFVSLVTFFSSEMSVAGIFVIGSFVFTYMVVLDTFSLEERSNGLSFLCLLPVPLTAIVNAKFLEMVLSIAFFMVYGLVLVGVAAAAGWMPWAPGEVLLGMLLGAAITVMVFSIYSWLLLVFRRTRLLYVTAVLVIIILAGGLGWVLVEGLAAAVAALLPAVAVLSPLAAAAILLGVPAVACFFVCLALARRGFSRRELP